ncbi:hypothetical protein L1276_001392 [Flavobacterium sp. HSC-32F16]|uniref:protease complex subunit PrcB family protein n=1 Tax=Flavobacterium sp. HSC-32F16 TaxID=2910964 RepID=UPI0020A31FFB|nr:protease complex subunit PrcB family protein [Flavobacterium sp. HSC-32F16]MCP2026248.1 hypothetical protein [Flavobacterium sp. HSC-32F16]
MKQILIIFSLLFAFTSCDSDESAPSKVDFTEVYQGDYFNGNYNNPKANLVINDLTEWNKLLVKLDLNIKPWQNSISTDIDFEKYQVIAVIDEVRPYNGYSIDITKITQTNDQILVKVEQLKPGGAATVNTQPYHIVTIPKSNKKVVFE